MHPAGARSRAHSRGRTVVGAAVRPNLPRGGAVPASLLPDPSCAGPWPAGLRVRISNDDPMPDSAGDGAHRTPRCRSSTRDVSIRCGLEDPTWDSVGIGGTGPRGADPRRGTSRFGAGSRTRHGTQWASEAQASCGADRFGTGFRTRQALWGVGALMIRRCRSTRAVSNRCGLLEPTRESGASERTGSDGAARRGLSRIGAGFWSRRGVRGVGAHRLRRCRSTRAVSNRCGPQNAIRDSGSDGAARRGLSRIGAGFRTAFRGTSSVCGPDSAWERMRGTIRDAWSEWTARSG